jgi:hypothetical protein
MMLALAQAVQVALRTPDTSAYMIAAYLSLGTVLALYALSLLGRLKKAKEE